LINLKGGRGGGSLVDRGDPSHSILSLHYPEDLEGGGGSDPPKGMCIQDDHFFSRAGVIIQNRLDSLSG
jgi:hypothetical protein